MQIIKLTKRLTTVQKTKKQKKRRKAVPTEADYAKVAEQMRRNHRGVQVASDQFLLTFEWRKVRMLALKRYGARCQCCGASPADGAVMNVDHIKPRKIFPNLALDVDNLQVLCHECNHGKGNWDMTDWRDCHESSDVLDADQKAHMRSILGSD